MNELLRLNKMMRNLKVFFRIVGILCIIVGILAVSGGIVWAVNGESYLASSGFFSRIAEALDYGGYSSTTGTLFSDAVEMLTLAWLLLYTACCIAKSEKEGNPFTGNAAVRVKKLGIVFFVGSLAAEMIIIIIGEVFSAEGYVGFGIFGGMAVGVVLLVMSQLIGYGAFIRDKSTHVEKSVEPSVKAAEPSEETTENK